MHSVPLLIIYFTFHLLTFQTVVEGREGCADLS